MAHVIPRRDLAVYLFEIFNITWNDPDSTPSVQQKVHDNLGKYGFEIDYDPFKGICLLIDNIDPEPFNLEEN